MPKRVLTEQEFLKDVSTHRLEILRDDGVYRHLRFRATDADGRTSYNMGFDLVTWPGWLAYTGDMGSYTFTRLEDMLQFFRRTDNSYRIDLRYWAEKCTAQDKHDGIVKFSPEQFRAEVRRWFDERTEDMPDGERAQLLSEVEREVSDTADDGADAAYRAALDFEHEKRPLFEDFYEVDCNEYTQRFEWCCFALAWAIQQYDTLKTQRSTTAPQTAHPQAIAA